MHYHQALYAYRPSRNYSFVRAGAAAYGLTKSDTHSKLLRAVHPTYTLMPVLEWKTTIIGIKRIEQGATIGYDRTFVAQRPTLWHLRRLATMMDTCEVNQTEDMFALAIILHR